MGIEQLMVLIEPQIVILVPVLIIIGTALKKMKIIKSWAIPLTLGILGMVISVLLLGFDKGFGAPIILEGVLQGILAAGMAVYAHQLTIQTAVKRLKD